MDGVWSGSPFDKMATLSIFVVQIWQIFQILQLNFLKAIHMAFFFGQNNVVKTCHQKTEKENMDPDSFYMVDYLLESNIRIWQIKWCFFSNFGYRKHLIMAFIYFQNHQL